ncbi:hypothetical protein DCC39_11260 [Pueribacillus theae]|uniref:YtxH domain-containing protein n=1 Tax=Pueribacillus theae TaxID=2171751 RepID=A0A2U1K054_9BACI|nr:YtxH domain-containing protein [Pueribacillus theae]PWA10403.1 hypothetical protein DCC39_11260 [Pueribacillus theae]
MKRKNVKKKILTGAVVGTLAGVAVAMLDKRTRKNMIVKTKSYSQNTMHWIREVKEDPHTFMSNVKEGVDQVSKSFKEVADTLQNIFVHLDEVKKMSSKVIEMAKDAGEDMKEVGSSLVNLNSHSENNLEYGAPMEKGETYPKLH